MCTRNLFWEEEDQCVMCQGTTPWWARSLGWYAMTFGWMNVYFLNAVQHFPLATQTFAVRRNDHWIPKASIKIFYWLQSNTMKISVLLISSLRYLMCTLFPSTWLLCYQIINVHIYSFRSIFFFSTKLMWGRRGRFFQQRSLSTYSRLVPRKGHGLVGRVHFWRLWSLETEGIPTLCQQEAFLIFLIVIGTLKLMRNLNR